MIEPGEATEDPQGEELSDEDLSEVSGGLGLGGLLDGQTMPVGEAV